MFRYKQLKFSCTCRAAIWFFSFPYIGLTEMSGKWNFLSLKLGAFHKVKPVMAIPDSHVLLRVWHQFAKMVIIITMSSILLSVIQLHTIFHQPNKVSKSLACINTNYEGIVQQMFSNIHHAWQTTMVDCIQEKILYFKNQLHAPKNYNCTLFQQKLNNYKQTVPLLARP